MRAGGVILSLLIVGGCLGGIRVFGTLKAGGAFATVQTNYDLSCTQVLGVPGTEDLVIDRSTGVVFVSSHDRRAELAFGGEKNDLRGGIYAYDPGRPSLGFAELTAVNKDGAGPQGFRPHGLSLYTAADGTRTLMVVNHPDGVENTVEIYDVIDADDKENGLPRLAYRITVTSPLLVNPNDLVALDAVRFYATNDHGSKHPTARMLEDYLRLNLASVVYFDGEVFHTALGGLTFANGIEINGSGDEIYVAETTDGRVGSYTIDPESGDLEFKRKWDLKYGVDNIDVAADGSLWIGGHPKLLDFVAHSQDPRVLSAGKVVRIDPASKEEPKRIFQTDGDIISGLSVAAEYAGKIVMGQVFGDGLLVCE